LIFKSLNIENNKSTKWNITSLGKHTKKFYSVVYYTWKYLKTVLLLNFDFMEKSINSINEKEYKAIAMRLKELRKQKGFKNYEHIAFDLGMSRSSYWKLEQGANFEIKTLIKVCRLLDVTLEEFFQGIQLPKQEEKKK
jgi:DNA-binding XRE family transcriptional regulator